MGIDNSNQTNPIKKKAIFRDQPAEISILKKDFEKDGYLFGNPLGTGSETRHGVYHVIKCLMKDGKIVRDGNNNPMVIQEFAAKVFREETIKAILSTEVENWKKIPAHKSIVTLRDIQTRKGYTVLFMDFFKGENLDDYVHDPKNQNNKGLSYGHYSTILDEALQGIHHAHQHNVIHRDITPHNIMVGSEVNSDGIAPVKIIDFGIAKIRNQAPTQTIGSPGYRAPESRSKVGAQATMDVFSIGVLANELFSCVYKDGIQGIADLIADKRQNDKEILPAELEQIVKSNVTSVNTIKDNKGNEVKDEWGNPKKVRPYQLSGMSFDQAGNIAKVIEKCLQFLPENRYQSVETARLDFNLALNPDVVKNLEKLVKDASADISKKSSKISEKVKDVLTAYSSLKTAYDLTDLRSAYDSQFLNKFHAALSAFYPSTETMPSGQLPKPDWKALEFDLKLVTIIDGPIKTLDTLMKKPQWLPDDVTDALKAYQDINNVFQKKDDEERKKNNEQPYKGPPAYAKNIYASVLMNEINQSFRDHRNRVTVRFCKYYYWNVLDPMNPDDRLNAVNTCIGKLQSPDAQNEVREYLMGYLKTPPTGKINKAEINTWKTLLDEIAKSQALTELWNAAE